MTAPCPQEPYVRRAAAEERWTAALREHARSCDGCAAAAAAAPFMARLSATGARPVLPDPSLLFLKARLLGGKQAAEKAARPLTFVQAAVYLLIAAGWAGLLTWKWDQVQRWIFAATPAGMVGELAGLQPAASVAVLLAMVMLSSLTVMVALHAILAEE